MDDELKEQLANYSNVYKAVATLLEIWPEHLKYVKTRFKKEPQAFLKQTDEIATLALKLMGKDLQLYCLDYKWMCENFIEELFYFQRTGEYRIKSFAQANMEIYSDKTYMSRYVRGILMSQIFWKNHSLAINIFRKEFLKNFTPNYKYLEIGPGHGLFFYFAAIDHKCKSLIGWDVSDSSIQATRKAMSVFGIPENTFDLVHQDVLTMPRDNLNFDGIVISEVLEHLETPAIALKTLFNVLLPDGKIFINVPVNSPAPDHIYLWRDTKEVIDFIRESGFTIQKEYYLPPAGYTLERARTKALDISCIIIAGKM